MNRKIAGYILRRERLARDWSQEGLCRGICAASYLSKIEHGRTDASEDILSRLFERMGIRWQPETPEMGETVEELYSLLFSGNFAAVEKALAELKETDFGPCAVDMELLKNILSIPQQELEAGLEPLLEPRQLALQRLIQGRCDEAIQLMPCAFTCYWAGAAAYESGKSYTAAVEYLRRGYDLAAADGSAHLMMQCSLTAGNCYCNQLELENMTAHYEITARLAAALGEREILRSVQYNTASAALEKGRCDEAYAYFSAVEEPTALELHKLAVCCEKLGRREQALSALDRADGMESELRPPELMRVMCAVVRFRLEHEDYLKCPEYGELLLDCFEKCRCDMPIGFASFHLPWVLEWYTAQRKYRQAYELLLDFPIKLK